MLNLKGKALQSIRISRISEELLRHGQKELAVSPASWNSREGWTGAEQTRWPWENPAQHHSPFSSSTYWLSQNKADLQSSSSLVQRIACSLLTATDKAIFSIPLFSQWFSELLRNALSPEFKDSRTAWGSACPWGNEWEVYREQNLQQITAWKQML